MQITKARVARMVMRRRMVVAVGGSSVARERYGLLFGWFESDET